MSDKAQEEARAMVIHRSDLLAKAEKRMSEGLGSHMINQDIVAFWEAELAHWTGKLLECLGEKEAEGSDER